MEGFEVLGVEINQEIAELYKHPVIVDDVKNLDPEEFKGYDLIVGSPPCRDFSTIGRVFGHRWKDPPDPDGRGLDLVNAFLTIVEIAKPTYWLLENVPQLEDYLKLSPRVTAIIGETMRRSFWGNYPAFVIPRDYNKKAFYKPGLFMQPRWDVYPRENIQWLRAKIPIPIARALGRAVISALTPTQTPIAEITNNEAPSSSREEAALCRSSMLPQGIATSGREICQSSRIQRIMSCFVTSS